MKKIMIRILTLGLACIMALSLAACGSDNTSSTANDNSKAAASQSSTAAESSKASTSSSGKYASIDEYVNSDIVQSQLESLTGSMEDNNIEMTVTGEGDRLIYEYTYTTDVGDVDTVVSVLEQGLEANASTFEKVASNLKLTVDVETPVVVVRYLTEDGKELCSREFSA